MNDSNSQAHTIARSDLFGCPVHLLIWDGTLDHAIKTLPMIEWFSVSSGANALLRFPLDGLSGNGSIPRGGWLLVFGDHVVASGLHLPSAFCEEGNEDSDRSESTTDDIAIGTPLKTIRCTEYNAIREALAELVAATREKWRTENGSLRQYKAVTAAEKLLKK